jgi:hypothetical protein
VGRIVAKIDSLKEEPRTRDTEKVEGKIIF